MFKFVLISCLLAAAIAMPIVSENFVLFSEEKKAELPKKAYKKKDSG